MYIILFVVLHKINVTEVRYIIVVRIVPRSHLPAAHVALRRLINIILHGQCTGKLSHSRGRISERDGFRCTLWEEKAGFESCG